MSEIQLKLDITLRTHDDVKDLNTFFTNVFKYGVPALAEKMLAEYVGGGYLKCKADIDPDDFWYMEGAHVGNPT